MYVQWQRRGVPRRRDLPAARSARAYGAAAGGRVLRHGGYDLRRVFGLRAGLSLPGRRVVLHDTGRVSAPRVPRGQRGAAHAGRHGVSGAHRPRVPQGARLHLRALHVRAESGDGNRLVAMPHAPLLNEQRCPMESSAAQGARESSQARLSARRSTSRTDRAARSTRSRSSPAARSSRLGPRRCCSPRCVVLTSRASWYTPGTAAVPGRRSSSIGVSCGISDPR